MQSIFISSTFIDMHFERDLLNERVLPELMQLAGQNGESVSLSDLRWGINTEGLSAEESSEKVLSVCFDEIERCRPYFVAMLGDRYGWIPDEEQMERTAASGRFTENVHGKSATELEIIYGILERPEMIDRGIFLFREMEGEIPEGYADENEESREKLRCLKARILETCPERVHTYTIRWPEKGLKDHASADGSIVPSESEAVSSVQPGFPSADTIRPEGLDTFRTLVTTELKKLLEHDWAENAALTVIQRDQRVCWQEITETCRRYDLRMLDRVQKTVSALEAGRDLIQIDCADAFWEDLMSGLMAAELRDRGFDVLPITFGTELVRSGGDVVRYIAQYIADQLGLELRDTEKDRAELSSEPAAVKKLSLGMTSEPAAVKKQETDLLRETLDAAMMMRQFRSADSNTPLVILLKNTDAADAVGALDGLRAILPGFASEMNACYGPLEIFTPLRLSFVLIGESENAEKIDPVHDAQYRKLVTAMSAASGKEPDEKVIAAIADKGWTDFKMIRDLVRRLNRLNRADYAAIRSLGGDAAAINAYQLQLIETLPSGESLDPYELKYRYERLSAEEERALQYLVLFRNIGILPEDLSAFMRNSGLSFDKLDLMVLCQRFTEEVLLLPSGGYYVEEHFRSFLIAHMHRRELKARAQEISEWLLTLPENAEPRRRHLLYMYMAAGQWDDVRELCRSKAALVNSTDAADRATLAALGEQFSCLWQGKLPGADELQSDGPQPENSQVYLESFLQSVLINEHTAEIMPIVCCSGALSGPGYEAICALQQLSEAIEFTSQLEKSKWLFYVNFWAAREKKARREEVRADTLYRMIAGSPLLENLMTAAELGKSIVRDSDFRPDADLLPDFTPEFESELQSFSYWAQTTLVLFLERRYDGICRLSENDEVRREAFYSLYRRLCFILKTKTEAGPIGLDHERRRMEHKLGVLCSDLPIVFEFEINSYGHTKEYPRMSELPHGALRPAFERVMGMLREKWQIREEQGMYPAHTAALIRCAEELHREMFLCNAEEIGYSARDLELFEQELTQYGGDRPWAFGRRRGGRTAESQQTSAASAQAAASARAAASDQAAAPGRGNSLLQSLLFTDELLVEEDAEEFIDEDFEEEEESGSYFKKKHRKKHFFRSLISRSGAEEALYDPKHKKELFTALSEDEFRLILGDQFEVTKHMSRGKKEEFFTWLSGECDRLYYRENCDKYIEYQRMVLNEQIAQEKKPDAQIAEAKKLLLQKRAEGIDDETLISLLVGLKTLVHGRHESAFGSSLKSFVYQAEMNKELALFALQELVKNLQSASVITELRNYLRNEEHSFDISDEEDSYTTVDEQTKRDRENPFTGTVVMLDRVLRNYRMMGLEVEDDTEENSERIDLRHLGDLFLDE